MSNEDKPMVAFILSLIAGILILIGGVNSMAFMGMGGYGMMGGGWMGGYGMMGHMMGGGWTDGGYGMMGQGYYMYAGLSLLVLISGIIVIIGAVMLQSKPQQYSQWGILILIFSIISILGGYGLVIAGLILGVIGGIMALTWKPKQ
jgi:hypothetical protein